MKNFCGIQFLDAFQVGWLLISKWTRLKHFIKSDMLILCSVIQQLKYIADRPTYLL